MNTRIITGEVVTLVTYPEYLDVLLVPHFGEYTNPRIVKLTPCVKKNGKYVDLRKGYKIEKTANTLEWRNLPGTVFRYEDGLNVLISRNFETKLLMCMEVNKREITNTMVVRKIFDYSKKKE